MELLEALRAEIERQGGASRVTFAPISAAVAERLNEHPGQLMEIRVRWRPDRLVDLLLTDPDVKV